jgi:hypothetical protein
MSDQISRPNKKAKLSKTPKPLELLDNPYSSCTIAELIVAIPPLPEYEPLPYRDEYRPPIIELPIDTNTDPYSLFTLFLIEAHIETIATNTNRYTEKKEGPKRRNYFIRGVDIINQLRAYYSTQRIALRSWYPLFFWILDIAILNAFLIGRKLNYEKYIIHKEFRVALWETLFSNSLYADSAHGLAKFYPLDTSLMPCVFRPKTSIAIESPTTELPTEGEGEYKWKTLRKWLYCYNCIVINTRKRRIFGEEISSNSTTKPKRIRPKQSIWGCNICDVVLCTNSNC